MSFFGRNRTPRAKRSPTPGSLPIPPRDPYSSASAPSSPGGTNQVPLYLSRPFADAALVKGNFKTIVMLPKYVDIMEWVAVNIFDFYTNLNEFYGVITECCTQSTCPTMSAGPTLNYAWTTQGGKQAFLSAPTYIDSVMSSIQTLVEDENVFPTKTSQAFSPTFPSTVKHIYRQLLRVFAHIYYAHYNQILHLRSEPHFNSLFAHFLAFGREYELLEVKDIRGDASAPVSVGLLWERWKEKGILEA
ncbi:hypothetical protein AX16_008051 [Volvariella volvacea WC 439]|nr:hypothetical protein AX16_008051 [Volvariella volvacea WC 439]